MTMFSPWQWFCSTRTFSNCLETTLTITALYLWPWEALSGANVADLTPAKSQPEDKAIAANGVDWEKFLRPTTLQGADKIKRYVVLTRVRPSLTVDSLRYCLVSAAVACILRPTNILLWIPLVTFPLYRLGGWSARAQDIRKPSPGDVFVLLQESINCGYC